MVITEKHTRVLIVGAGPSGLMMAAQLLRYGVQPIIIDRKQGPTTQSNALVVQARSLEIYRQMGIADRAVKEGKHAKGLHFNVDTKQAATFEIATIGQDQTPFPYVQIFQQNKNERLLLDELTLKCCPVYWNTSLISFQQTTDRVTSVIQAGEKQQELNCDWIIGADGAHSEVRKQTNIPFNGDSYQHRFFLADIVLEADFKDGYMELFLAKNGFTGFFPLPEAHGYRLIGVIPEEFADKKDLTLTDVLPGVERITGHQIGIKKCNWFTTYRLHHRMADQFRLNRCFLIGDAAHIHSPVGGQGMNTGLQDAYNLAWKLAAVINGQIKPGILESYNAERNQVAKDLLRTTDKVFNIVMANNILAGAFKKFVLPKLLNWLWGKENFKVEFFKRISQIGIQYRDSSLSLHLSHANHIKAGDRLPYLEVFDEKKQQQTDLHEWCSKPGFTVIALGKLQDLDLFSIAKWITQRYRQNLNFFYLPPSVKNQAVFDAFELKEGQQKAIIVRPDMYIGFINDWIEMDKMDNYLKNIVGFQLDN